MTPRARDVSFAAWIVVGLPLLIALAIEYGPRLVAWLLRAPTGGYLLLSYAAIFLAGGAFVALLFVVGDKVARRRLGMPS